MLDWICSVESCRAFFIWWWIQILKRVQNEGFHYMWWFRYGAAYSITVCDEYRFWNKFRMTEWLLFLRTSWLHSSYFILRSSCFIRWFRYSAAYSITAARCSSGGFYASSFRGFILHSTTAGCEFFMRGIRRWSSPGRRRMSPGRLGCLWEK